MRFGSTTEPSLQSKADSAGNKHSYLEPVELRGQCFRPAQFAGVLYWQFDLVLLLALMCQVRYVLLCFAPRAPS